MVRNNQNKDIGQWKRLNVMYGDVSNEKRYVLLCYQHAMLKTMLFLFENNFFFSF